MAPECTNFAAAIQALRNCLYTPVPYSGRGMNGAYCVAVKNTDTWRVAVELCQHRIRLPRPNQEQLGMGIVLYWPSLPWPGAPCPAVPGD